MQFFLGLSWLPVQRSVATNSVVTCSKRYSMQYHRPGPRARKALAWGRYPLAGLTLSGGGGQACVAQQLAESGRWEAFGCLSWEVYVRIAFLILWKKVVKKKESTKKVVRAGLFSSILRLRHCVADRGLKPTEALLSSRHGTFSRHSEGGLWMWPCCAPCASLLQTRHRATHLHKSFRALPRPRVLLVDVPHRYFDHRQTRDKSRLFSAGLTT